MYRCSSSNSALVRARDQTWVPGSIHSPHEVVGYRLRRPVAAGRHGGPIVQIDQRLLARRSDDDIATENLEPGGGSRTLSQPAKRSDIERIPRMGSGGGARGVRIVPVKERRPVDAVKLDLVARAMGLQ